MAITDLPWRLILPGGAVLVGLVIWLSVHRSTQRQAEGVDSDASHSDPGHDSSGHH